MPHLTPAPLPCRPPVRPRRRQRRTVAGRLAVATCAALLAVCACQPVSVRAGDTNALFQLLETWWQPYVAGKPTQGLFHLDYARPALEADLDTALDAILDPDAVAADQSDLVKDAAPLPGVDPSQTALDASLLRRNGKLNGATEWLKDGHFDGGLGLRGGSLVLQPYGDIRAAYTCEAWLRPLGDSAGTVFSMDGAKATQSTITLSRLADGHLTVTLGDAPPMPTDAVLPPDQWTHLAMIVSQSYVENINFVRADVESNVELRVNGNRVALIQDPAVTTQMSASVGSLRIGDRKAGGAALRVDVDELRVSSGRLEFYPLDLSWVDTQATQPLANDQPYLRDRADLVLEVSFDGKAEPTSGRLAVGTVPPAGALPMTLHTPYSEAEDFRTIEEKQWVDGIRGQALRVGGKGVAPTWELPAGLDLKRGTLILWFRPVGWDNRREQGMFDPLERISLIRLLGKQENPKHPPPTALGFGVFQMRPQEKKREILIHPGRWYQLAVTWENGKQKLWLDGKLAPPNTFYTTSEVSLAEGVTGLTIDPGPGLRGGSFIRQPTLIDEVCLFDRPLTAVEMYNAWARYAPDAATRLRPLPYAEINVAMNIVDQSIKSSLQILDPDRVNIASVSLKAYAPEQDTPIAAGVVPVVDNCASFSFAPAAVSFGAHHTDFDFLAADGTVLKSMRLEQNRKRPDWFDNNLGIHPGKVMPGFDPVTVADGVVGLWGRRITLDGSGLPTSLISQNADLLAAPIQLIATPPGGTPTPLVAAADSRLQVVSHADDMAVTTGAVAGAGVDVQTRMTTEFDGMIKVELTIKPGSSDRLDALRVEIPFATEHASFFGMWTGKAWFRGATRYERLPTTEGELFRSDKPGREGLDWDGSFLPYMYLGDDERGMAWFAENDEHWTRTGKAPATPSIQIVRDGGRTALRLNLLTEPTTLPAGGWTYTFGLMPTPWKALPQNQRQVARGLNFGFVDSFSKQSLKSDSNSYGDFQQYPNGMDWDAAIRRGKLHNGHYRRDLGYAGPILYTDRRYVGTPPDSSEYINRWFGAGHMRYYRDSSDCMIWLLNQWISHNIIHGIYIDDMWLTANGATNNGLSYTDSDGKIRPGFEWFDYHAHLKRMRWLFYDNGQEPFIWGHMTATNYPPMLSFLDVALDGEERFLDWGSKSTFQQSWGADRIRFHNGAKWGYIPMWMNKIGNDKKPPGSVPQWFWRQQRSYFAYLLLHDVNDFTDSRRVGEAWSDLTNLNPAARFLPYWDRRPLLAVNTLVTGVRGAAPVAEPPAPPQVPAGDTKDAAGAKGTKSGEPPVPVVPQAKQVLGSAYIASDYALLVLVNDSGVELAPGVVKLDLEALGLPGLTAANAVIDDVDTYAAPPGEDATEMVKNATPSDVKMVESSTDELDAMFNQAVEDDVKAIAEETSGFKYTDTAFTWSPVTSELTLRLRAYNYRLLRVRKGPIADANTAPAMPAAAR